MAIENVRHPIKDTVKADNSTYSSNKIESLIHSATELPETSAADAGDVLMVNEQGEWDKGEIIVPQELPTPAAADIGKIVSVVSDGDEGAEYSLEDIPNELPVPTQADNGKSVYVSSGHYTLKKNPEVWKVKKSGSSYFFEDTSVNGSNVVNYVMSAVLDVVTNSGEEIALRGEKFYVDTSLGLPMGRYSAITNDGTHTYYKYIDVSVMASAPITGLTLNSVTIV